MKQNGITLTLLLIVLTACSVRLPDAEGSNTGTPPAAPQPVISTQSPDVNGGIPVDLKRTDSQGSVEFIIAPLSLNTSSETIDFSVVMDTHSIDLSWNLAAQSTLTADNGLSVVGSSWPTGSGHHVQGTLKFPTKTADGKPLLDGAKKLTLTIKDAGAPTRVFEWTLAK